MEMWFMQRTNRGFPIVFLNTNLLILKGGIVNKIAAYISYNVNFCHFTTKFYLF